MALTTQYYNLDLVPDVSRITVVHCSVNDTSRHIVMYLFSEGIKYTIPKGTTARIEGTKPNGVFIVDINCRSGESFVEFDLKKEMDNYPGSIICAIVLTDSDGLEIGTGSFILQVNEGGIVGDIDLTSTDFSHYLRNMEAYLDQVASDKKESAASAETAAKYAEAVKTAEESAVNAATSAKASAQNAENSAQNAKNAAIDVSIAKKWAVGDSGSGNDTPSDNNNSYYYAQMAKFYSSFNAPTVWVDFSTMSLMMEIMDDSEVMFRLDENKNLIMGEM